MKRAFFALVWSVVFVWVAAQVALIGAGNATQKQKLGVEK